MDKDEDMNAITLLWKMPRSINLLLCKKKKKKKDRKQRLPYCVPSTLFTRVEHTEQLWYLVKQKLKKKKL
jgi:hypothetical protein